MAYQNAYPQQPQNPSLQGQTTPQTLGQPTQYPGQYQQGQMSYLQLLYSQQTQQMATLSNINFGIIFFFLILTGVLSVVAIPTDGFHLSYIESYDGIGMGIATGFCICAVIMAILRLGVSQNNDIGAAQKYAASAFIAFFLCLVFMAYETVIFLYPPRIICGWFHAFLWLFYGIAESGRSSQLRRGQGQVFMTPMVASVL